LRRRRVNIDRYSEDVIVRGRSAAGSEVRKTQEEEGKTNLLQQNMLQGAITLSGDERT
jgi:hypothetical protein